MNTEAEVKQGANKRRRKQDQKNTFRPLSKDTFLNSGNTSGSRKTFGTDIGSVVQSKLDLQLLRHLLGHKSSSTTTNLHLGSSPNEKIRKILKQKQPKLLICFKIHKSSLGGTLLSQKSNSPNP